jgi:phosphatidylserine/phosphatidylglycerophosphate/cardiolipin synthase-like enzyme
MERYRSLFFWLLAGGLAGCSSSLATLSGEGRSLPQDAAIQVYFNQRRSSQFRDPLRGFMRAGDNLEQQIVSTLRQANQSIEVAVQELQSPAIAQALIERYRVGIPVRVIVENTYRRPWSQSGGAPLSPREKHRLRSYVRAADRNHDGRLSAEERQSGDAMRMLEQAGIPILDDRGDGSRGSGLMHHKFAVVDGQTVLTGSANFTPSDLMGDADQPASRGNANHLIQFQSPALAAIFQAEFARLWGDGPGKHLDSRFGRGKPAHQPETVWIGKTPVTVLFSPFPAQTPWQNTTNGLIGFVLNQAQQEVDMALFVFSEQRLANILAMRHQQGTRIRLLVDPGFAYRPYSEVLDLLGITLPDHQCRLEANNQPWSQPLTTVGIPKLPAGDLLHHKFAVVDRKAVITGSHNWSAAAAEDNDETLLLIQSPQVAAHFRQEFDRLYREARLGMDPHLGDRLRQQQQRCQRP